jgi:hypothetical protein
MFSLKHQSQLSQTLSKNFCNSQEALRGSHKLPQSTEVKWGDLKGAPEGHCDSSVALHI